MTDLVRSLLRTYIPIAVGALASWLLTLGIDLDASAQAGLVIGLTAILQGAYYTLVRAIEPHLPDRLARILLGSAHPPVYGDGDPHVTSSERAILDDIRAIEDRPE